MSDRELVKTAVLDYLRSKSPLPGDSEEEWLAYAFVDKGHLSSFQILEMVLMLEDQFPIHLTPEHMQSPEFRTVGGLVNIICNLMAAKLL